MFENRQDTSLLRNALISSSNYLKDIQKSQGTCNLKDEETAVQIVVSTVSSLSSNLYGINTFHELFEKQQNTKQRCHAVVFINLLKSQNISCPEADSFYQSVLYEIDNLDWSYYLRLNFLCNWSEYFIECVHQLQPDILTVVLQKLLEVQCEGELKSYACHMALQAYIRKAFELRGSSLAKSNNVAKFAFHFCISRSPLEETKAEKSALTNSLPSILDLILSNLTKEPNQKVDINYIKVVFHGFKTIFKSVNDTSLDGEDCIEKLNLLTPLLVECLTDQKLESVILQNMKKPFQCLIDSSYQSTSWEIHEVYLVFLLQNFWKDFRSMPVTSSDEETALKTVAGYRRDFHDCLKQKDLSYKTLIDLNERHLKSCSKIKDNYFLLLTVIVKHHYPYASRAAESLLTNTQLWEKYNVISLIEENTDVLHPFEFHITLADAIVKADSTEIRERLLNVFYKVLSKATPDIYNLALENILKNWAFCESFMLSNFDAQLTYLSRKTMSPKEVEETFLPLFVQSPKVVLQFLIEQAMMQGIDGVEALKVLKTIPVACLYEYNKESVAPLVAILSPYFEHSLRANEAKHFVALLKTLMEIQVTEDILSFDLFLDKCIFPNSLIQNVNQLEFTLECLKVTLDVLISNHALEIRNEKCIALLKHLGGILSFCIENSQGKLKETVVDILKLLSKYRKLPPLDDLFQNEKKNSKDQSFDVEDVVKLYIIGIFFKEINPGQTFECSLLEWKNKVITENFEYLWIWCCITCNIDDFVDNIPLYKLSYEDLLKYLPSILWHSTINEWLQAAKIIMYYQHLLKVGIADYPWLLPHNDPELYGVIRCLIDSFTLMMCDKSSRDILYSSSCLTNTIMDLLGKTTIPPSLLVNIFLDICCLASYIDSEAFFMFSTVLMGMQKQYLSICDKADKKDCIKLMKLGLNNIQNDILDIESLKEKFCQV